MEESECSVGRRSIYLVLRNARSADFSVPQLPASWSVRQIELARFRLRQARFVSVHEVALQWDGGERVATPGTAVTFGRGSAETPVDIRISSEQSVHRRCGRIEVLEDGWVLSNVGREKPIRVHRDGTTGTVDVESGTRRRFEGGDFELHVRVHGRRSAVLRLQSNLPGLTGTVDAPGSTVLRGLQTEGVYFKTLLVLCEHALRTGSISQVPHNKEIAARLRQAAIDEGATADIVEDRVRHLESAVRGATTSAVENNLRRTGDILGVREELDAGLGTRDAKVRLIDAAIALGIVKPEHLDLLPDWDD